MKFIFLPFEKKIQFLRDLLAFCKNNLLNLNNNRVLLNTNLY